MLKHRERRRTKRTGLEAYSAKPVSVSDDGGKHEKHGGTVAKSAFMQD